jgi:hypothetical protein
MFKASREEPEIGAEIVERSLKRQCVTCAFQIRRPTYH